MKDSEFSHKDIFWEQKICRLEGYEGSLTYEDVTTHNIANQTKITAQNKTSLTGRWAIKQIMWTLFPPKHDIPMAIINSCFL